MPGAELGRRARLVMVAQDLVTPVRVILGYQEIIVEEGQRLGLEDVLPYLLNVLQAARTLHGLVERLLDPGAGLDITEAEGHSGDQAGIEARLRHDLRTPLNAIIGYSELALEDLGSAAHAERLRSDVERLLDEARRLMLNIDTVVDLSRSGAEAPMSARAGAAEAVVAGLLRTLAPAKAFRRGEVGRILVVDDDFSNRDLLRRRLAHEGHEILLAASGRQALDILEHEAIDLILLDLLMPDMNGIEVLETLKSDTRWYAIPVVMISGLSETDAVMRCIEAGAEDYLPKPFDVVLLRARINAGLERKRWRDRERDYLASLRAEKERSEALLRNILPDPIVLRLNEGEKVIADRFEAVSILFADIVGFTPAAAMMSPANLVGMLDRTFSAFDDLALHLGVEKIKTIGDSYMAAAGLPLPCEDYLERMAEFALGMLGALDRLNSAYGTSFRIRIGMHSGPVIAGIIGRHKFIYDVWGDTVNMASRLESHGVANRIQVSETVRTALAGSYDFEQQGTVTLKGRGEAVTYFLVSRRNRSVAASGSPTDRRT
jgi:adenylate cyclase